jgi:hypothetical protein
MKSLRGQLRDKLFELVAEVEHGEAFYEGGRMLDYFCENCDELKRLARELHEEYKTEEDD